MGNILVPIFICVVLPVAIVLIISLTKMNADNKRSQVLMKAIEMNPEIDAERLTESLTDRGKKKCVTPAEILNHRLLRGCKFSLIGLVLIVVGLVNFFCGAEFSSDPVTASLIFGGISAAVGVSYLIVYFVSRRQLDPRAPESSEEEKK